MSAQVGPTFTRIESMHAQRQTLFDGEKPTRRGVPADRLAGLAALGAVDIESPLVADLSGDLHALFDPVCEAALPIYFGPLLGRLYLEGL